MTMKRRKFLAGVAGGRRRRAGRRRRSRAGRRRSPEITKLALGFGARSGRSRRTWSRCRRAGSRTPASPTSRRRRSPAARSPARRWSPARSSSGRRATCRRSRWPQRRADRRARHQLRRDWRPTSSSCARTRTSSTPEDLYSIKIGLLQGSTASADLYYLAQALQARREAAAGRQHAAARAARRAQFRQHPGAAVLGAVGLQRAQGAARPSSMHTGLVSGISPRTRAQTAQISYTRSLFVASQEFVRKNPIATRRDDGGAAARAALRRRSRRTATR